MRHIVCIKKKSTNGWLHIYFYSLIYYHNKYAMFDDRHKFDTDNLRLLLDKYVISFLDNFYFLTCFVEVLQVLVQFLFQLMFMLYIKQKFEVNFINGWLKCFLLITKLLMCTNIS